MIAPLIMDEIDRLHRISVMGWDYCVWIWKLFSYWFGSLSQETKKWIVGVLYNFELEWKLRHHALLISDISGCLLWFINGNLTPLYSLSSSKNFRVCLVWENIFCFNFLFLLLVTKMSPYCFLFSRCFQRLVSCFLYKYLKTDIFVITSENRK